MSVRPILIEGEQVLRQIAAPVGRVDDAVRRLARDMIDTMYAAPGRGLAAPQIGVALRMFVMDVQWKDGTPRSPRVMIDPDILERSAETATREEGCLSIPGVPVSMTRPAEITLAWTDLDGQRRQERLTGAEATCAQHEYDHLDGILITDSLDEAGRAALAGSTWTPVS